MKKLLRLVSEEEQMESNTNRRFWIHDNQINNALLSIKKEYYYYSYIGYISSNMEKVMINWERYLFNKEKYLKDKGEKEK